MEGRQGRVDVWGVEGGKEMKGDIYREGRVYGSLVPSILLRYEVAAGHEKRCIGSRSGRGVAGVLINLEVEEGGDVIRWSLTSASRSL